MHPRGTDGLNGGAEMAGGMTAECLGDEVSGQTTEMPCHVIGTRTEGGPWEWVSWHNTAAAARADSEAKMGKGWAVWYWAQASGGLIANDSAQAQGRPQPDPDPNLIEVRMPLTGGVD